MDSCEYAERYLPTEFDFEQYKGYPITIFKVDLVNSWKNLGERGTVQEFCADALRLSHVISIYEPEDVVVVCADTKYIYKMNVSAMNENNKWEDLSNIARSQPDIDVWTALQLLSI